MPKEAVLGDIVVCDWLDAHANVKEEFSQEEIDKMGSYRFSTYGILVRDDRGKSDIPDPLVALAAEVGEDGRYRGVTFIPASWIVAVKQVKSNQPRKRKLKHDTTLVT